MKLPVDVVVFDLDDTLYPERDYVRSGFQAVDAWLVGKGIHGFMSTAWEGFEAGTRGTVFNRALESLGVLAEPSLIAELLTVYRTHAPTLTLPDETDRVLDALRRAGHRVALLTDGYLEVQQRKVSALSLTPRMDAVVYSDALGRDHWKPSPAPYKAVMAALGCSGSECVYVGDNPRKDFVSARALGWSTVRMIREGGEHAAVADDPGSPAHHTIRSLHELLGLLASTEFQMNTSCLEPESRSAQIEVIQAQPKP